MTTTGQLILKSLRENNAKSYNTEIFRLGQNPRSNEFLLILKPEVFTNTSSLEQNDIIEIVEQQLAKYSFQIDNIRMINATYMKQYRVIDNHYGVINSVARDLKSNITHEAVSNFERIYGQAISKSNCYGAIELLEKKVLTSEQLSELWKNVKIERLAGGIYAGKTWFNGRELYIINGFHPPQLDHFVAENRVIVTMNVSSDTSWKTARSEMIGNTYPENAATNSMRGKLFKKYGEFGFDNVSYVLNSVHLSAGPLEGLIELQRFNSKFENKETASIHDFSFGKLLKKHFSESAIKHIVSNPTVLFEGKQISLFDLTEEMDSNTALEVLKSAGPVEGE